VIAFVAIYADQIACSDGRLLLGRHATENRRDNLSGLT
jgi:hypothetical protein